MDSVSSPEPGAEYPNSLFAFEMEPKTWNRFNSEVIELERVF